MKHPCAAQVAYACGVCSYALCRSCATPTHTCEARCVQLATNPALITFMKQFVSKTSRVTAANAITTEERLRANLALYEKVNQQRDWVLNVPNDREIARTKLTLGRDVHAAWLQETYKASILA